MLQQCRLRKRAVDVREFLLFEIVIGIEREVPVLGRLNRAAQSEVMGELPLYSILSISKSPYPYRSE